MEDFTLQLKLTEEQNREMKIYTSYLSTEMILFGLRFAFSRCKAISGGYLLPGRKSIIKKETRMLSRSQADWRLRNWKSMIRSYRQRGYSYPTISRIKKQVHSYASKG
jgi:hypothetical protein